ncbi:hypothetical protein CONPUDRAFT_87599 [Coniophora puteana RWD-64-598 SS2]|uniref:TAFII55 protein conserved region domain-containing protein n=1 Tax=Coniophora puteana (strain RWD-64-598) TaxID=741705 RepID=A0A5M3N2E5_CONPW|nr:uncharacterized protein CONPUDRAFT_87599 [Coniophora puteana RWD-64-598 SS2]EIW85105.1 hypothetical protein CONPUDRAFT_87599 [Coniophora puteana RWD-64-598 SS2]
MDEDVIVVDDELGPSSVSEASLHTPVNPHRTRPMRAAAEQAMVNTSRIQGTPGLESERTTRSAAAKFRPQPKLKFKLSDKAASQAPCSSFLGPYDRELDSDDEDLAFEEQFIIRMPPGEDCEKLRKMVASREVADSVWFKFKDSRRGIFHIGNSYYSFKLVDLPCIIEAQKTLDSKQMFKVADICQMMVVEYRIGGEDTFNLSKNINVDEFIWPHGITPPLHHARKRRFRKRVNKRTIESVEEEVERLLAEDGLAAEVQYDVLENVNPDLSDSEFIDRDERAGDPGIAGSDAGDAPTPGPDAGDGDADEGEEDEGDGEIDEDLAAELDLALGDDENESGDEEEEDDEDESEEEEEGEDDDDEAVQSRKLLNEEIRDLQAAVAKKGSEIASSANPLIKKRFEDALKKLQADLDMKLLQREEMKERQQRKKESGGDPDTDAEGVGTKPSSHEVGDDLFGVDGEDAMEVG